MEGSMNLRMVKKLSPWGTSLMTFLPFREPMNALTHGMWMLVCIPGIILLLRFAWGDRIKTIGLAVYGCTMISCFFSSWLFHSVNGPDSVIEACRAMDHVCIYLFIAGTCTPVGLVYLEGRWRWAFLSSVWGLALTGVAMRVSGAPMPLFTRTTMYVLLGWLGILTYFQLVRKLSSRKVVPVWLGGVIYTTGAGLNLADKPVLFEGIIGPHEFFHCMVILGSLVHYYFMIRIMVKSPSRRRAEMAVQDLPELLVFETSLASHPLRKAG